MNVQAQAHGTADPGGFVRHLQAAELTCKGRGVQLTPIRRAVLEALWKSGQPLGAYEILRALESTFGRRLAPPTVYRALEFLLEQKLVARIESISAFIRCVRPEQEHGCVFYICQSCGRSDEIENPDMEDLFERDAAGLGFRIGRRVVELQGTCAICLCAAGAAGR